MRLDKWIAEVGGPSAVARLLNVSPGLIGDWKHFRTIPSPRNQYRIVKVSKGQVTYTDMIEHFAKVKGWKR